MLLPLHKSRGFTLIEVLVASFILFLVIAAITMVYRGATLSSFKAQRVLQFSALVGPISEQVRIEVRNSEQGSELNGQGKMGGIDYTWQANLVEQSTAPLRYNVDSGEYEAGDKIFGLVLIDLQLKLNNGIRDYQFHEVHW